MSTSLPETAISRRAGFNARRTEVLFAIPIVALVIYLFYTWFAVRDRFFIFLYYHDMGAGFDTSPFGRVTASRYWMSGLVAAGAVMVLYIAANFLLGRVRRGYHAPVWWRLWLVCAAPLAIAIPAIVMTVNEPVLPFVHALWVVVALLAGLALAFVLGEYAARRPLEYLLLLLDGCAITGLLVIIAASASAQKWIAAGNRWAVFVLVTGMVAAILGLPVMTLIYAKWRRPEIPKTGLVLAAGGCVMYLFLPLYHHLFGSSDQGSFLDPDYFGYITDSDNFFSPDAWLQIGGWVMVVLLVAGVMRLRRRLGRRITTA